MTKGEKMSSAASYKFVSGKDEVIREGKQGYIVTFGECLIPLRWMLSSA